MERQSRRSGWWGEQVKGGDEEKRFLYIEASDDALVSYHNELGFQPKDLYAMCQVGESSKRAPGSGKIGRKGIGFKSVFQVTDRPLIVSPPFQFQFDTCSRGIFGYIVPSWVDQPYETVPAHHHRLLRLLGCPITSSDATAAVEEEERQGVTPARTGTLLVCPLAARAWNRAHARRALRWACTRLPEKS